MEVKCYFCGKDMDESMDSTWEICEECYEFEMPFTEVLDPEFQE